MNFQVGFVEAGISDLTLSPDEELLTLITAVGNVVLMTRDYDVLKEFPIHTDEFGELQ